MINEFLHVYRFSYWLPFVVLPPFFTTLSMRSWEPYLTIGASFLPVPLFLDILLMS